MKLPEERCFHFPDGTSASSLDELRDKIETISYDTFYHHVDHSKNDFASWIRYVLKDERLADELEKVESIVETVEILNDYLHPKGTKKHLDAQDDMQSKIEAQIGFSVDKLQEPAPPTEPAPEMAEAEDQERAADEQEEPTPEGEPATQEPAEPAEEIAEPMPEQPESTQDVNEEIERIRTRIGLQEQHNVQDIREKIGLDQSRHYRRQEGEKKEIESFHEDMTKLIVKDFIWGMLFGLVIGFLLARMLGI